jgi:cysteine desulfurase/selenocysteine lyase
MDPLEECALGAREQFPILDQKVRGKDFVYLDSAATAHKPDCVIDCIANFYRQQYGTVHRAIYTMAMHSTDRYAQVREQLRAFLNAARSDELVFTRGTTEAINLVAYSYGSAFIGEGDEVLVSTACHHSNIVPWQMHCERSGAHLIEIPVLEDGRVDLSAYRALLSERTKMVSISHVFNSLGTINPIKEMAAAAHEVGAVFLADGAQAVPHQAVDLQDLGVDFYAFSGHKMYAPTGVGALYARGELLERMPPFQGGGDMIDIVSFSGTTYNTPPLKFEAGTPDIAQVIGLGAAIEWMEEIGCDQFVAWEHRLLERATQGVQEIEGLRIIGTAPEKAGILSFVVDGVHHLDIGTLLDLKGIAVRTGHHCTMPLMERFSIPGTVRASFAIYNTLEEVDYFVASLKDVIAKLR